MYVYEIIIYVIFGRNDDDDDDDGDDDDDDDDDENENGRFYTKDALSVWDELGQTTFTSSSYASR